MSLILIPQQVTDLSYDESSRARDFPFEVPYLVSEPSRCVAADVVAPRLP